MITLIGVVFLHYTYKGIKVKIFIKQTKRCSLIDEIEYKVLSKKSTFTLCYAFLMVVIGILYITPISLNVLVGILIVVLFIVSLIGHDSFVLKSDLDKTKKNKSAK